MAVLATLAAACSSASGTATSTTSAPSTSSTADSGATTTTGPVPTTEAPPITLSTKATDFVPATFAGSKVSSCSIDFASIDFSAADLPAKLDAAGQRCSTLSKQQPGVGIIAFLAVGSTSSGGTTAADAAAERTQFGGLLGVAAGEAGPGCASLKSFADIEGLTGCAAFAATVYRPGELAKTRGSLLEKVAQARSAPETKVTTVDGVDIVNAQGLATASVGDVLLVAVGDRGVAAVTAMLQAGRR